MRQRTELRQRHKHEFNARFNAAIEILQMPVTELANEIRDVLESNPLLEEVENYESAPADSYDQYSGGSITSSDRDADWLFDYAAETAQTQTVQDHLLQQLSMTGLAGKTRAIAKVIIQSVDDRGYLSESIEDIQQLLAGNWRASTAEIEQTLVIVQQLGPPGIAARSLNESLLNQLGARDAPATVVANARTILRECFELLAKARVDKIVAETSLSQAAVLQAIELIKSLNPSPGNQFGKAAEVIMPDLIARKVNQRWQVRLNSQALPRLRISAYYRGMIDNTKNDSGQTYLKKSLTGANLFIDSINRRHDTVLRVAREIVRHQHRFLDDGELHLQPLKIADIAESLELHESTVSRACARKYIMTPTGTYELKSLFSVRIPNRFGHDESAQAIKQKIARLVDEEDMNAPLSDHEITERLRNAGAKIARRTVAKYRAQLYIPARNLRRSLNIHQTQGEVM